jgi:hypothetical protein
LLSRPTVRNDQMEQLRDGYIRLQLQGDRREALRYVDQLVQEGLSIAQVRHGVIAFPARLVADALDLAGYDARFLGADVPTESLLTVLDESQPDLLALSITMKFHEPALREQIKRVRTHTQGRLPIAIGGRAFGSTAAAVALGADAGAMQELLSVTEAAA